MTDKQINGSEGLNVSTLQVSDVNTGVKPIGINGGLVVSNNGTLSEPEPIDREAVPGKPGVGDSFTETLTNVDGLGRTLSIFQLGSASMMRLALKVQNQSTVAVVDTAAEVTIVSDKVFNSWKVKPKVLQHLNMHAAGRGMLMKSFITGPVDIVVGSTTFRWKVYIAPIDDDMLLGLDFLKHHNVVVDLIKDQLIIQDKVVQLTYGKANMVPKIAKVTVPKRTVIPPNSAVLVKCNISEPMNTYVAEPIIDNVLIPRAVYSDSKTPTMCFLNIANENKILSKGQTVAEASEVDILKPDLPTVREVSVDQNHKDPNTDKSKIPDHLVALFENSKSELTVEQCEKLKSVLINYSDVFATSDFDLGQFTSIEHTIDTGQAKPIKQRMRRTPMCFINEEEKYLKQMLDAGIIEPSTSEWASPPVLIRKRDGKVRWCVDYRKLNSVTKKDVYPLPLLEECLDALAQNVWFSKLDANSAYYQVIVNEADRDKTAFITKYGLFQFVRMSFGLCNAPSTYMRVMNLVLRGLSWDIVLAFLDDMLVLGKNFDHHLENLQAVLSRFRHYGLKLKPAKCELFKRKVEFLGREVDENGMQLGKDYVIAVEKWSTPKTSKQVEQFLGFANYHRAFIKDYAKIANPLYNVTGKKLFQWTEDQQTAFDNLKRALTTAPVLTFANNTDPFILDTDASNYAIGGELIQIQNGQEKVVAYGSFSLNRDQIKYCTTRKELLAVVRFTRQFRHYLLGRNFIVRTDHSSLTWLLNFKEPQGQLARWFEELSQYNMTVKHRPGSKHANADGLSRIPSEQPCFAGITELPCGGCDYCARAHKNWAGFTESVDDTIPLASNQPAASAASVSQQTRTLDPDIDTSIEIIVSNLNFSILTSLDCDKPTVLATSAEDKSDSYGISHTEQEIVEAQKKDPDMELIRTWLETHVQPSEATIFLSGPGAKSYWINRDTFVLEKNGLINYISPKDSKKRLLVPRTFVKELLALCHDLPASGHQGILRTKLRISEKYHWYKMCSDIKDYVRSCQACNKNKKATRNARCHMTQFHAGVPMERVHLDFLGPMPETKSGNAYVLMMVDQFTKWVECIPLPSQTAEVTARAAVNEFFSRFGYPFQVFTDQGRNFESDLFKAICEMLHIHKTRTTPYRPSANGQVERFNRSLMNAVRCFVGKQQDDWDVYLPQLAGALRSSVNRSTGFTPNQLMLGRKVYQPVDIVFPQNESENSDSADDYVSKLRQALRTSHEIARDTLKTTQEIMKRDYDLKIFEKQYKPGDFVYVLDTATIKGKNRKLSPPWKGPGIIIQKLTPYVYKVKLKSVIFTTSHDRLKPCSDRNIPAWLERCKHRIDNGEDVSISSTDSYCICGGPDTGQFMIQCDICDEWYHGKCVSITKELADTMPIYRCIKCQ